MPLIIQLALLLITCTLAARYGQWPEKSAAGLYLAMMIVDQAYHWLTGNQAIYRFADIWHTGLDALALILVVTIALKADRIWTIWLGSAQLLATGSHLTRAIDLGMPERVYAVMLQAPVWLAILLVTVASLKRARAEPRMTRRPR